MINLKPISYRFLGALFVLVFSALLAPSSAQAARVARFAVSGVSTITTTSIIGIVTANCSITIVNTGSSSQSVTYTVTATGTGGYPGTTTETATKVLVASGTGDGVSCSGASDFCNISIDFVPIPERSVATQMARCEGTITVDNVDASFPGFISASGQLITNSESTSAVGIGGNGSSDIGDSNSITTSPASATIEIGEGRPF